MKHAALLPLLGLTASGLALQAHAQASPDWPGYGRDPGGQRHSPLRQITPANVAALKVAWTYHMRPAQPAPAAAAPVDPETGTGRRPSRFIPSQATPIVVNGLMYLPTPYGRVVALDADTGKEVWAYALAGSDQAATRGVAYWPGADGTPARIVFGTRMGKLIALDAATGRPAAGFGTDGIVDMKTPDVLNGAPANGTMYGMSSPPLVYRNLVITGSRVQEMPSRGAAGDVRAWDVRTGRPVWTFHTIPRPGEPGHDTWEGDSWKDRSGVNVWTFPIADAARGIVYLPVASPTFDRWGGDRKGANLYGATIVALDAATGRHLWHFQTVHHDIWDLDLTSASLVDVRKDGRTIPAIAVMNKTAILFLLDRVTGKPVYPVREVPVPTGTDVASEAPWPTQPMPSAPPPLARLSFRMSELADVTPELKARCEALVREWSIVESRMFQPLRADSAVAFFPGSFGGVDWGGAAYDPALGYYIVNINSLASPQQLEKQADGTYTMKGGYRYFWDQASRLPCQRPPWGELVAVNLNTGRIAWRRTLGVSDNLPPGLQDTGRPSLGGPITTAAGLTFVGATDDNRLRAFDSRTGKLLWETRLPASVYATPMTYQGKTGRQYIAAVNTGGIASSPVTSDEVTAFALP